MKCSRSSIFLSRLFLLALLFQVIFTSSSQSQSREKMEKEIKKIIKLEPSLDMEDIPAYVIGIIKQDSVYVYGYGSSNGENTPAPDEKSIFELGGLTKVFTAALLEILAAEGKINLDSSLNNYLPRVYRNPKMQHITLTDLLGHRSGLPKMPMEFGAHEAEEGNPYAHYSKKDLLTFYHDFFPEKGKAKYTYSHVNYALLEIAVEQVTQQSFAQMMQSELLGPLSMKASFFHHKKSLSTIQGHSIGGQKSSAWAFPSFAGSEGMKSCLEDLMCFAKSNLREDANSLSPILQKTHSKLTVTDYSKHAFSAKGWHVIDKKRYYDILVHTGNTSGFRSFFGMVPETQTAVIVLSSSERATGGLGFLILRMINHNWRKKGRKIRFRSKKPN